VSAGNDCFYCMDSHGAFASELLTRASTIVDVDAVKSGGDGGASPKVAALLSLARIVRKNAREVSCADVKRALDAGASDGDTQLTVLIASAFCMYNRMVD